MMKMIAWKKVTCAGVLAMGALVTQAVPAMATEPAVSSSSVEAAASRVNIEKLNDNQFRVTSKTHIFRQGENGGMVAVDRVTGVAEDLPGVTTDATGASLTLYYRSDADGVVTVTGVREGSKPDSTQMWTTQDFGDDVKCWLGIVGSGVGGALAGAGAGSAVPALGTLAGGVGGAFSGTAVGTATFC